MEEKEEKKGTVQFCLDWIKKIKDDMNSLNESRVEALKFFRSEDDIVEKVEGQSKATTTDLMDLIEWIKPSLLRIFTSGDEVASIKPRGEEDVEIVKNQDELVNYQIRVKNKWFEILHDFLHEALLFKLGVLKYQWHKEKQNIDKEYNELTDIEYQAKIQEPDIQILKHDEVIAQEAVIDEAGIEIQPAIKTHNVKIRYIVEDEYPLIESIPSEDIGFPIKTRNSKDVPFFYHKVKLPKWKIKKRYGEDKFKEIEEIKQELDDSNVTNERFKDLGGNDFFYDKENGEYIFYESYYPDENTGEPKITTICGDVLFRDENNPYGKPPFLTFSPFRMPHRAIGFSLFDLIKQTHQIRTALLRQILTNIYFINNPRVIADPYRINMDDLKNSTAPRAIVRVIGGDLNAIKWEEKPIIPPQVFNFWEMMNIEKDYHSGITRSFQGVNPDVLNKTWRGQSEQITQAQQRVEMMARLLAETVIAPLISDIIDLNIKFLKKKTAVRVLNEFKEVTPDNIVGKFDVIVNVGIGTGDKERTIMYMQQLLGLYAQVYQSGMGIVNEQNAYNTIKELVKAMGYKNTSDFVTNPNFNKKLSVFMQFIAQRMVQYGIDDPELTQLANDVVRSAGIKPQQTNILSNANVQSNVELPMQANQPMNPAIQPMGNRYFG